MNWEQYQRRCAEHPAATPGERAAWLREYLAAQGLDRPVLRRAEPLRFNVEPIGYRFARTLKEVA